MIPMEQSPSSYTSTVMRPTFYASRSAYNGSRKSTRRAIMFNKVDDVFFNGNVLQIYQHVG